MNDDRDDRPEEGAAYARTTDPDTSHGAADAVEGSGAAALELEVLKLLHAHPEGMICHELVAESGVAYQSITPRFAPLRTRGLIVDSGMRRRAPESNRPCIVWLITGLGTLVLSSTLASK